VDLFELSLKGQKLPEKDARINRYLASAGVGSRREVENLVRTGRVEVDGRKISDLSERVPSGAMVRVSGKLIRPLAKRYFVLNKPAGVVCSHRRFGEDRIVEDLLPEEFKGLRFAGRLDRDTRGLLVLSTDGDFLHHLSHPSSRVTKKYTAVLDQMPDLTRMRNAFTKGIEDEGEKLRAISVRVKNRQKMEVEVVLHEGKNHQVRRMFEAVGSKVVELVRTACGFYDLESEGLKEGELREVTPEKILYGDD
jgi:23S rRNA pseudouridine2605 synthase